jgi:hypothetical protein
VSSARITALEAEVAGLRKALVSRTVIGQATGLIAARKPCTPQQAFQLLVHISQHHNIKLHVAADRLVTAFVHAYLGRSVEPADQMLWDHVDATTANDSGGSDDGFAEEVSSTSP